MLLRRRRGRAFRRTLWGLRRGGLRGRGAFRRTHLFMLHRRRRHTLRRAGLLTLNRRRCLSRRCLRGGYALRRAHGFSRGRQACRGRGGIGFGRARWLVRNGRLGPMRLRRRGGLTFRRTADLCRRRGARRRVGRIRFAPTRRLMLNLRRSTALHRPVLACRVRRRGIAGLPAGSRAGAGDPLLLELRGTR